jgi:type IV secretion system protein VirD4
MFFNPADVGWHLGRAHEPRGGDLWVPWDPTAGVIGPQGSGKTLDVLIQLCCGPRALPWLL